VHHNATVDLHGYLAQLHFVTNLLVEQPRACQFQHLPFTRAQQFIARPQVIQLTVPLASNPVSLKRNPRVDSLQRHDVTLESLPRPYTRQSMAKITSTRNMNVPPMENRTWSDMACPAIAGAPDF
jgi:hypothetical protein